MTDSARLREQLLPKFQSALDFAAEQAQRVLQRHPGYCPMYTVGGKWGLEPEHWTHWCEGFYPGIYWLLHSSTADASWRRVAEEYSRKLEPRRRDRNVHDLGFLFFSTYLRWYQLTNDPALAEVLIEAGKTLALRRQKGGYLASFIGPQSLFIDIMMNVGIVFWAANATKDAALREVAMEHCRTTAHYLVRPDGGTAHEGLFGVESGRFEGESTHQGWKPESTWSRGLAWAIYGFTAAQRLSLDWHFRADEKVRQTCATLRKAGTERKLSDEERALWSSVADGVDFNLIACRCADYYLRRAPAHLVPYWDFDARIDSPPLWDSSAAAITASGLWDLADRQSHGPDAERYRCAALTILDTLCGDEFLARSRPGWEGILLHGVYHKNKGLGVDESVAWGDHFFVEALVKAVALTPGAPSGRG